MVGFALVDVPDGVDVDITGPWGSGAERTIMQGLAQGLVLNYARGYSGRDLSFLEGLPIRSGGGFVTFAPAGHGDVSVLVTAHTPVRFEEAESESRIVSAVGVAVALDIGFDYELEYDMGFGA